MGAFKYVAINAKGQQKKGLLEGDSARQVRQQLRQQGLSPIELHPIERSSSSESVISNFISKQRINSSDLASITRQLATLLMAAIPLEEALMAIAEQAEKPKVKAVVFAIHARIKEGHSLSTALDNFPEVFNNLYRATVAAGEQTGLLDNVLNRLADYTEQRQKIRKQIQQA